VPPDTPITASLFLFAEEAAQEIKDEHSQGKTISVPSPALTFFQNFFVQFFANVCGKKIVGTTHASKITAAKLRLTGARDGETVEWQQLIAWFERFCDNRRDIAADYGDDEVDVVRDFHESMMLGLLDRIVAWANAAGEAEIAKRAEEAKETYEQAIQDVY
jgi:hypothetical protein